MARELYSEDEFLQRALAVPAQRVFWRLAQQKGVEVWIRRDDLIDVRLSGNKFYKLFYNLTAARAAGYQKILTFGGAYSNHLYAVAAAGREFGFETIGVVRGERPNQLSQTLRDAEAWGMTLRFMSRADYREKMSEEMQAKLLQEFGDVYQIPEGGANQAGAQGTKVMGWALAQQLMGDFNAVCLACGTGNTLAGLTAGLAEHPQGASVAQVLGFSVLKGVGSLGRDIANQPDIVRSGARNWRLISGYHCGGYGHRLPDAVHAFYQSFERECELMLDPVYTVKMCWGVAQLMTQNYWPRGSRLMLIHTGGLQGRRGFFQ